MARVLLAGIMQHYVEELYELYLSDDSDSDEWRSVFEELPVQASETVEQPHSRSWILPSTRSKTKHYSVQVRLILILVRNGKVLQLWLMPNYRFEGIKQQTWTP